MKAAGVMFLHGTARGGRVLLLRYSAPDGDGLWTIPGGHCEEGEDFEACAKREAIEETGFPSAESPAFGTLELHARRNADGVDFATFLCKVAEQFTPVLSDEHDSFCWQSVFEDGSPRADDFVETKADAIANPMEHGDSADAAPAAIPMNYVDTLPDRAAGRYDPDTRTGPAIAELEESGAIADAEFREEDHPRAPDGKFGSGGGSFSGKKAARLTPTEKSYVTSYTGDRFFDLNKKLRGGEIGDAAVKHLDAAINKSTLPKGTTLYRGMSKEAARSLLGGADIKRGQVFEDKAFVSTGKDREFVSGFYALGGVVLEIETGDDQRGLDMQGLTDNPQESEVLLPRNTKMEIQSIVAPTKIGQPVRIKVKTLKADAIANPMEIKVKTLKADAIANPMEIKVKTLKADAIANPMEMKEKLSNSAAPVLPEGVTVREVLYFENGHQAGEYTPDDRVIHLGRRIRLEGQETRLLASPEKIAAHETGHAVDHALGWASHDWEMEWLAKLLHSLEPDERFGAAYYLGEAEEAFAESFAILHGPNDALYFGVLPRLRALAILDPLIDRVRSLVLRQQG